MIDWRLQMRYDDLVKKVGNQGLCVARIAKAIQRAILLVLPGIVFGTGFAQENRPPSPAAAQATGQGEKAQGATQQAELLLTLAEQYFDNERLAEAAVCFEAAAELHPQEEFREKCRKRLAECDTGARLIETIPFTGKFRRMWLDEATSRLLVLSDRTLLLYDLTRNKEIQRLELAQRWDHWVSPSGDSFPDPLHASIDRFPAWMMIHADGEVFAGVDTGDDQAFAMRRLKLGSPDEITHFRRVVNGEHARAIIYHKEAPALLIDPESDFAVEWEMPDKMHPIDGMALSPDGTRLVVAVNQPLVARVFDLENDRVVAEAKIEHGLKAAMAFSREGKSFAYLPRQGIEFRDTETAELISTLSKGAKDERRIGGRSWSRIVAIDYSDESGEMFLETLSGVEQWDWRKKERVAEFWSRSSRFGKNLIAHGADPEVAAAIAKRLPQTEHRVGQSETVPWISPIDPEDHGHVISYAVNEEISLWNTKSQTAIARLEAKQAEWRAHRFHPRARRLTLLDEHGHLKSWRIVGPASDSLKLEELKTRRLPLTNGNAFLELHGNRVLFHRRDENRLGLWAFPDSLEPVTHPFGGGFVATADGHHAIIGNPDKATIAVINLDTGNVTDDYSMQRGKASWTDDGQALAVTWLEGKVPLTRIYDTATGKLLLEEEGITATWNERDPARTLGTMSPSAGGRLIFSARLDNGRTGSAIWDRSEPGELHRIEQSPQPLSAHGKALYRATDQGAVRYWDLSDLSAIPPPTEFTYQAGFRIFRLSPWIDRFVTAVKQGPITLWNPLKGEKVREFYPAQTLQAAGDAKAARPELREIFLLPNDQGYAVWLEDGHMQIWNQDFESLRWQLHEPGATFETAAFSFDGKLVALPGADSKPTVRLLSTVDGSLLHEVKIGRHLWSSGLRFALDSHRLSIQTVETTHFFDPKTGRVTNEKADQSVYETIYLVGDRRIHVTDESTTIRSLEFGAGEFPPTRTKYGYRFDGAKVVPAGLAQ